MAATEGIAVLHSWKVRNILTGTLTFIPPLNAWRARHSTSGGTLSLSYCYSVWRRHLQLLLEAGFRPEGACIAELGPGDTIGVGLAALLSGVRQYSGLDLVPFAHGFDPVPFFDELCRIAEEEGKRGEATRSDAQPVRILSRDDIVRIRTELERGMKAGSVLNYCAPWHRASIPAGSLDLVLSQSVLQYSDCMPDVYQSMFHWLRPGGYASHRIDCSAGYLSPHWNGHWAYSDFEWRLTRGRREFLMNREPIGVHLKTAEAAGFQVVILKRDVGEGGLPPSALCPKFQNLDAVDSTTRGANLVLRRPA